MAQFIDYFIHVNASLNLQISYKDNILFSLNKETVEKSFGLLKIIFNIFF